jgi:hypothetical protein
MNEKDEFDDEHEIMARAAALPKDIAPGRDLWPGIERAIRAPAAPRRPAWDTVWAKAASVLLLVGASSSITYLLMEQPVNPTSPVADAPALIFQPTAGSFGAQYNLGPDYLDAHRNLAGSLDAKLAELPEETRAAVESNLETIHKAIDDINKALAEDPDNVLLQELLLNTYREELDLMITVDGAANAAMRRGDI